MATPLLAMVELRQTTVEARLLTRSNVFEADMAACTCGNVYVKAPSLIQRQLESMMLDKLHYAIINCRAVIMIS